MATNLVYSSEADGDWDKSSAPILTFRRHNRAKIYSWWMQKALALNIYNKHTYTITMDAHLTMLHSDRTCPVGLNFLRIVMTN
jgi:hypothetical protein